MCRCRYALPPSLARRINMTRASARRQWKSSYVWLVYLFACLPTCVCVIDSLFPLGCVAFLCFSRLFLGSVLGCFACLLVLLCFCLFVCLFVCLLDWLVDCLLACVPACLLACLLLLLGFQRVCTLTLSAIEIQWRTQLSVTQIIALSCIRYDAIACWTRFCISAQRSAGTQWLWN